MFYSILFNDKSKDGGKSAALVSKSWISLVVKKIS